MYYVEIKSASEGLHPNESIVTIETTDCEAEAVIDKSLLVNGNLICIGYPVGRDGFNKYLVELPAETVKGDWRIWVNKLCDKAGRPVGL